MKTLTGLAVAVIAALSMTPVSAVAQSLQRLTDDDVKQLVEDVDKARDIFTDRLDAKLRGMVLHGPATEMKMTMVLDDFKDHVKNVKDRFKRDYAASQEVQTLLEQAGRIDAFLKAQPPALKGLSEWDRLAVDLRRLAATYATQFPLPTPVSVRRINDAEAAATAEHLAKLAEEFKDAVGSEKDQTVPAPARDKLKVDADALEGQAKALKARLSNSQPATAEARLVFDAVDLIRTDMMGLNLSPATMMAFGALRAPMVKLEQAFGKPGGVPLTEH